MTDDVKLEPGLFYPDQPPERGAVQVRFERLDNGASVRLSCR